MSQQHQHQDEDNTTTLENNIARLVVLKLKKHWFVGCTLLLLGYNPMRDFVSTQYPIRGNAKTEQFRGSMADDNHVLIQGLIQGREENSNNIVVNRIENSNEHIMLRQDIKDLRGEMNDDFKHLESRVDRIFEVKNGVVENNK